MRKILAKVLGFYQQKKVRRWGLAFRLKRPLVEGRKFKKRKNERR